MMTKGLRLALFHLTGAGIVLVFGAIMVLVDLEVPETVIGALVIGISFIMAVFAVRILIAALIAAIEKKDK